MKKVAVVFVIAALLGGCASKRAWLPHIPKDMEITNLEININSPWGGSTVVKAESYKSANYDEPE